MTATSFTENTFISRFHYHRCFIEKLLLTNRMSHPDIVILSFQGCHPDEIRKWSIFGRQSEAYC